jgi:predicted dehydrogenase
MSPNETPRFGLIGTGVWAKMVHAPVAAASDIVAFTSVLGRNPEAARALAEPFGAKAYADLPAFLDSVDIVGLSLPPDVQPEFALAAAAAGKHLLLEKPVAIDPAEANAIADAIEARGLKSVVFFAQLLMPRILDWIAAAGPDGWTAARIDNMSQLLLDPENPFHKTAWRANAGALWDTGPHAVALLNTVLGEVVEVSASRGLGDLTSTTLRHRGGALSTIASSFEAPAALPGETAFFGAAGKLILPPSPDWFGEVREAYARALMTLVSAAPPAAVELRLDARFGATITRILAAAHESLDTGRRIALR